jgi:hypothetical protein
MHSKGLPATSGAALRKTGVKESRDLQLIIALISRICRSFYKQSPPLSRHPLKINVF